MKQFWSLSYPLKFAPVRRAPIFVGLSSGMAACRLSTRLGMQNSRKDYDLRLSKSRERSQSHPGHRMQSWDSKVMLFLKHKPQPRQTGYNDSMRDNRSKVVVETVRN